MQKPDEKRFYAAFDPDVPSPGNLYEIYVDLDDARGGHIIEVLERAIRIANPERPICRLLSGHKGSGKTVELMHLKQCLEKDKAFTVIHWLAEQTIDLMAVDFPDLLLGLVAALAREMRDKYGIDLRSKYFAKLPGRMKKFLNSDMEFGGLDLSTGIAKMAVSLKQSPEVRAEVRKALEPESGSLLTAANEIISDAKKALKDKGFSPNLVLLIDDLDKGGWEKHPTAGVTTGQFLFVNRFPQVSGLDCHVIYTLPLELAYGSIGGTLQSRYGDIPVIPMVQVQKRPPGCGVNTLGVKRMREIIKKRLQSIGVTDKQAFAPGVMDRLIQASGGDPRQLMHLVSDSLLHGTLPLSSAAADRAITLARRTLRRTMSEEDWRIIRRVEATGALPAEKDNQDRIRSLLFNRQILQYCNGEEWVAPSPLLGDTPAA
jgi:hypothetical protein